MKLDLKRLAESPGEPLSLEATEAWDQLVHHDLTLAYRKPVLQELEATDERSLIRIQVHLETEISEACSRCLEPIPTPIELDEMIELFEEPADGLEGLPIEGFSYPYHADVVELRPIFERLILSCLPTKPLCRPDCKGLCPHCGIDLNEQSCDCSNERTRDPRLEVLRELIS